jgi:transcriptional regulator with XRE-family HTH domain
MSDLDRAASAYLRARAGLLGVSQKEIAERADIPQSTLNRYWKGSRSMSLGDLKALITALDDDLANALGEIDRLRIELQ